MKKNLMMRMASVLLIAVLMSTCAISGTFAKYVTSDSATDTARVAKWGVDFVVGSDLFSDSYETDDTDYASMVLSVKSDNADNVVAPGTKGTGFSFATDGDKPEVSYRVTFAKATDTVAETIYLGADEATRYYPVKFALTFNGSEVTIASQNIEDVLGAVTNCTYYFDVTDQKYYVSTDNGVTWSAAQDTVPELVLSWSWDFYKDDATDVLDTALGDLAAGETVGGYGAGDYNLEILFKIVATATQID